MNRQEIEAMLESNSDSYSEDYDDTDADPNWSSESEPDENIYERELLDNCNVTINTIGNNWNNDFSNGQLNSHIIFNPDVNTTGINPDIIETMSDASPIDFFYLFFDKEIIDMLVVETNRYANAKKNTAGLSRHARIRKWVDTNEQEIKLFFGIAMWMGMMKLPSIAYYWKNSKLYSCNIPKCMSRNRFEIILSMLHISDNDKAPTNDRLYKIQILIDLLVEKFNSAVIPEESVCIDESMVPYLGRLSFRQYISNKRHRYGVKIFKLCTRDCYTSKYKIYAGKEATMGDSVSCKVVMELMEPYLDFGRTLYADNWYNSIDLAEKLLQRKTHLVGTLRSNRKRNPKDVTQKKLNRGEIFAKKSDREIMVLKWRDRRDVLMISTKHSNAMEEVMAKRGIKIKPKVVIDYNRGKGYIDLTDQMGSYSSCLRRGVKWYRKVAMDIICNTSLLNAFSIYKGVTGNSKTITQFKDDIINGLIQQSNSVPEVPEVPELYDEHKLVNNKNRGRCNQCYKYISRTEGNILIHNCYILLY